MLQVTTNQSSMVTNEQMLTIYVVDVTNPQSVSCFTRHIFFKEEDLNFFLAEEIYDGTEYVPTSDWSEIGQFLINPNEDLQEMFAVYGCAAGPYIM